MGAAAALYDSYMGDEESRKLTMVSMHQHTTGAERIAAVSARLPSKKRQPLLAASEARSV